MFEDFQDTDSEDTEGKVFNDIIENAAVRVDAKEVDDRTELDRGRQ